jgi:hypothetical protein
MLNILHKGIQISLALNPVTVAEYNTGDTAAITAITSLKAGRLASLASNGFVALADGATDQNIVGFIIDDAAGEVFGNSPAIASGLLAVTMGNCVVVTDQIANVTFAPGQALYAGTSADVGLVTNVAPATLTLAEGTPNTVATIASKVIGLAGNVASSTSTNLKVLVV